MMKFFNLLMFAHLLWLFKCDFFSSMLSYGVVLLFTKFTKCMWVFYLDFGHVGFKAYYRVYLNLLLDSLLTSFPFATPFSQLPLSSPWRQFTSFPLLSPVLFVLPLSLLVPTHLSWLSSDPWALPKFFILFSWFHFQEFCLFLTCPLTICHTFFLLIS